MKELFTMWKNVRMIVLVAVTAAVYAAVLIPFKIALPLIPGFTEIRPANVFPIICSLMFGPAAAWGAAIGNTIGDFFGTLGPGTFFGFLGNFLYGYIPYRLWKSFGTGEIVVSHRRSAGKSITIALIASIIVTLALWLIVYFTGFSKNPVLYVILVFVITFLFMFLTSMFLSIRYLIITFTASAACGVIIGWGVHILGLVPFSALGNIIVLNNLIASAVLGPILLPIIYPVVKRMGLIYTDIMEEKDLSKARKWGSALMIIAVVTSLIVGNWVAIGGYKIGIFGSGFAPVLKFSTDVGPQVDMDKGFIPQNLRVEFQNNGIQISEKASVSRQKPEEENKWLITDSFDKYIVEQTENKINVYAIVAGRGGLGLGLLPFVILIFLSTAVM
jgi:energy-coupling factor transport system substrate-specific component